MCSSTCNIDTCHVSFSLNRKNFKKIVDFSPNYFTALSNKLDTPILVNDIPYSIHFASNLRTRILCTKIRLVAGNLAAPTDSQLNFCFPALETCKPGTPRKRECYEVLNQIQSCLRFCIVVFCISFRECRLSHISENNVSHLTKVWRRPTPATGHKADKFSYDMFSVLHLIIVNVLLTLSAIDAHTSHQIFG